MASVGTNVNCGFARVAMKELSENVCEFKRLFQHPLQISDEYFDSISMGGKSQVGILYNAIRLRQRFRNDGSHQMLEMITKQHFHCYNGIA